MVPVLSGLFCSCLQFAEPGVLLQNMNQIVGNNLAAMQEILHTRVEAAEPVETLSDRGNKLVQVVEEEGGQRFVTRSYTGEAVSEI